jgi:hypothetical protein
VTNEPSDPLLQQFGQLLNKYEERVALFKDHFMGENGVQVQCEGVTFEQDVAEIEKIKEDLSNLRKELEEAADNGNECEEGSMHTMSMARHEYGASVGSVDQID